MTTALVHGSDAAVVAEIDNAERALGKGFPLVALRIFCEIERECGERANRAQAAARDDGINVSFYRRKRYLGRPDSETLPELRSLLRLAESAEQNGPPLVALGSLLEAQALANTAAGHAVAVARRDHGTTWDVIADVAGLGTRDGAQKRWREAVDVSVIERTTEGPASASDADPAPLLERPLQ